MQGDLSGTKNPRATNSGNIELDVAIMHES